MTAGTREIVEQKINKFFNQNSQKIAGANAFNGGCERWVQMELAFCLIDQYGYFQNVTVFAEEELQQGGRADLVLAVRPHQPGEDKFLVVELKVTPKSAKLGPVVSDILSIWNRENAKLKGGDKEAVAGAFIMIVDTRLFKVDEVKDQIVQELKAKTKINIGTFEDELKTKKLSDDLTVLFIVRVYPS